MEEILFICLFIILPLLNFVFLYYCYRMMDDWDREHRLIWKRIDFYFIFMSLITFLVLFKIITTVITFPSYYLSNMNETLLEIRENGENFLGERLVNSYKNSNNAVEIPSFEITPIYNGIYRRVFIVDDGSKEFIAQIYMDSFEETTGFVGTYINYWWEDQTSYINQNFFKFWDIFNLILWGVNYIVIFILFPFYFLISFLKKRKILNLLAGLLLFIPDILILLIFIRNSTIV